MLSGLSSTDAEDNEKSERAAARARTHRMRVIDVMGGQHDRVIAQFHTY